MIKIVAGTYGYVNEKGFIVPKTAKDEPFELSEEDEARLVNLGVAEYVSNSPRLEEASQAVEPNADIPVYDVTMKQGDLYSIAKAAGLTLIPNATKGDIVKMLDKHYKAVAEVTPDNDEIPKFDPSGAIQ